MRISYTLVRNSKKMIINSINMNYDLLERNNSVVHVHAMSYGATFMQYTSLMSTYRCTLH